MRHITDCNILFYNSKSLKIVVFLENIYFKFRIKNKSFYLPQTRKYDIIKLYVIDNFMILKMTSNIFCFHLRLDVSLRYQ